MTRIGLAMTTIGALAMAAAGQVSAAEPVYLGDVQITHQPPPASYQPEGSDDDLADQGKSFDIACTISDDGRLSGCAADDNAMYDQNFVRIALSNVGQWVVAPQTVTGEATAGRTLIVTVQFRRSERSEVALANGVM